MYDKRLAYQNSLVFRSKSKSFESCKYTKRCNKIDIRN